MRNKLTWILFGVGTTLGTFMFTTCQGPDASAIIRLPKQANITRIEEKTLGGEVWFTLPNSKPPEQWLRNIADLNGMVQDSETKYSKPDDAGMATDSVSVDYDGSAYHAQRHLLLHKQDGLQ